MHKSRCRNSGLDIYIYFIIINYTWYLKPWDSGWNHLGRSIGEEEKRE